MPELIGHGAEAKLFRTDDRVIKERPEKEYRIADIDKKLRRQRTRREAKMLQACESAGIPAPRLISSDDESMVIEMSFIDGPRVRDVLTPKLAREIGRKVGLLHTHDIIHADLTTSNMIYNNEIHIIDFGLSFVSNKVEDKAVDVHMLDATLKSSHHDIYGECIKEVYDGYKESNPDAEDVLARLDVVNLRGRNKRKGA